MKTRSCLRWLWRCSRGVRTGIFLSSLAGVLHVAVSMAFIWFSKSLVDAVTRDPDSSLVFGVAGMALCLLLQILFNALESRITAKTDVQIKNRLRQTLFDSLMESRWDGKEAFHSGDTLNRMMDDVRTIAEALCKAVPSVIVAVIQFVAAFCFLFLMSPLLAWLIPGLMLLMFIFSRRYLSKMRQMNGDIRKTEGSMHSMIQENLQHRVLIHTLEQEDRQSGSLAQTMDNLFAQVLDKTDYSIKVRSFMQAGFSMGYASAFLWGVFGIRAGSVTFGMMTSFLQLVGQIQRPMMNLSRQFPYLVNSLTSVERLEELLSLPKEDSGEPQRLHGPVGVRIEDLTYAYPSSSEAVFSHYSHDFAPGSMTALTGETGVGKSTLMRLMLGLLHPDKGSITLYDSDDSYPASSLTRCNIVFVPQGNTLMSGSVRDNLLLGDPQASEAQMREVLHLAAADFVLELPDGLDTICGERGSGLSEGQAQRIAIARALLRKGGLLLLDEPTASLDSETETTLLARLSTYAHGHTLIIVTHRPAALSLCKNVVHL